MQIYKKYIAWIYIKTFFIVFIALELFFVGVELLTSLENVPKSANLALLYMLFSAGTAIKYLLPLSIVLSSIITLAHFIRNNELVSFFSLGFSKNTIIKPIFALSVGIIVIYIILQSTPLAYTSDFQKSIANKDPYNFKPIFIKDQDTMVYFGAFMKEESKSFMVSIFEFENGALKRQVGGFEALFDGKMWNLPNAFFVSLPDNIELGGKGFEIGILKDYKFLEGFKPQVVYNLQDSRSEYSVSDAIDSMSMLNSQALNTTQIRTSLYFTIFFPFFAPFMSLILYYYMPTISRFSSVAITSFLCILATLCIWGVLFVLSRFAQNAVIAPELAIIAPIIILGAFGAYKYRLAR